MKLKRFFYLLMLFVYAFIFIVTAVIFGVLCFDYGFTPEAIGFGSGALLSAIAALAFWELVGIKE